MLPLPEDVCRLKAAAGFCGYDSAEALPFFYALEKRLHPHDSLVNQENNWMINKVNQVFLILNQLYVKPWRYIFFFFF